MHVLVEILGMTDLYNKDGYGDWDDTNSANRYRDRSFDEDYDLDKEDSDSESKQNNQTNVKKYKDTDQPNSPTHVEKRVNINLNTSITSSPKKTNKPLKKVDLGAAANFGRDASQSPMPQTGKNLLSDDFDPRSNEIQDEFKSATEFGDFETAFGDNPSTQKSDESFADFSSAFSQNSTQNNHPQQLATMPNLLGPAPNVIPNVIPPPNVTPNLNLASPIVAAGQPNFTGNSLIGACLLLASCLFLLKTF
ncbi:hypothetical protein NQ318_001600 [Aromia moschata]|uniref:Uncharacterized protein n=1 Tax=Aromia moschata TaxID=1265417 RepID=A0AAV8Y1P4_9CUCU|nr:hypothetical protein NQ318_001600 [Aromia moschata]